MMETLRLLRRDFRATVQNDPTARGAQPILYPCFHAIALHRLLAHPLYGLGFQFLARLVNQITRFLTGLDIHPGARIGGGFFVDHGMGVVIGETAEVGENCVLFHNVTLGGTGHHQGKRHPTLDDHVVVGTGAKVLGNITIGARSKIGAGSVVVKSVPPHSTVVGVPGRVVAIDGVIVKDEDKDMLEHGRLPDPVEQAINGLQERIAQLEAELRSLREGAARSL